MESLVAQARFDVVSWRKRLLRLDSDVDIEAWDHSDNRAACESPTSFVVTPYVCVAAPVKALRHTQHQKSATASQPRRFHVSCLADHTLKVENGRPERASLSLRSLLKPPHSRLGQGFLSAFARSEKKCLGNEIIEYVRS